MIIGLCMGVDGLDPFLLLLFCLRKHCPVGYYPFILSTFFFFSLPLYDTWAPTICLFFLYI